MDRIQNYRPALFLLLLAAALAACTIENDSAMEGGEGRAADESAEGGADAPQGGANQPAIKQEAVTRMQQAIARYGEIQQQGGLPRISGVSTLEVGQSSESVAALREYLAMTGDLQSAPADSAGGNVYTRELARAVARFQKRHGIEADGVPGAGTIEAMNVPVAERLRQMEASMERLKALPDQLGQRFVLVNIPEFALHLYDEGKIVDQMRVVVGEEYEDQQTPQMSEQMEHVVFSPYWNVPDSIAANEIVPDAREDSSYLAENGFEIVSAWGTDAEPMEATAANLDKVESGELKLRQKPGDENSLGRVKFMLPNKEAIYLHGTPADHLFGEDTRAFSHGCIRVERPVDLALYALEGKPEWTRERIEQAMNTDQPQEVALARNIPVHLTYLTAYVDRSGQLQFREDIYGLGGK